MYTKETLNKINSSFVVNHGQVTDTDVVMANRFVGLIESSRSNTIPMPGDIVCYTSKYGEYYHFAHIESIDDEVYICEKPYVPFVSYHDNELGFITSGGAYTYIPKKLQYVGTAKKTFCRWGHLGAMAHGTIDFEAEVSVWEYSETDSEYTTKDYNKGYLWKRDIPDEYGYIYSLSSGYGTSVSAWKTELEMQAWMRTYRVEHVENGAWKNQTVIWYWKEEEHQVSPSEYDSLDLIEDTMTLNGLRKCKRKYDNDTHIIHTYYVWYWDEPGDFLENSMKQNEIRKKYEVDWRRYKENEYARAELLNHKAEPIDFKWNKEEESK